jgi:hypothetical protein
VWRNKINNGKSFRNEGIFLCVILHMRKWLKAIMAVSFIGIIAFGFSMKKAEVVASEIPVPVNKAPTDAFNNHLVDSTVSLLHSGDVVLRMGTGADSYMLMHMSKKDKRYSHCGIVMVENGYPFVYHSIGGETNPDERMRRDSAHFFFSPVHNTAIGIVRYGLGEAKAEALEQTVRRYYGRQPRFDMQFDLETDDKLYCSEFIYKAMGEVMHDTGYIHTTVGTIRGRYVGIDDLYLTTHAQIISQVKFKQYLCAPQPTNQLK